MLGVTLLGNAPVQAQATTTKLAHEAGHAQKGTPAQKGAHAQYECTHCNIMTMKAGNCPVCKMKMTKATTTSKKAQYECTHCQVMSAKAGKCPVCKMDMTKMKKASTGSAGNKTKPTKS